MLQIKPATPEDAQAAFDIRLLAIRSQCIGAYTREQMMSWTRGSAADGYNALMDKAFYLGWVQGEPVVTGMLDLENLARQLAIDTLVLDATLNAAGFYRARGYVGDEQAVYHSPSGLVLACIPMTKRLVC